MSELSLDIANSFYRVVNKIESALNAFMNSKFMKAYEEAAVRKAELIAARHTYRELQKLTDKELHDIGITRGEIYDVSYNGK